MQWPERRYETRDTSSCGVVGPAFGKHRLRVRFETPFLLRQRIWRSILCCGSGGSRIALFSGQEGNWKWRGNHLIFCGKSPISGEKEAILPQKQQACALILLDLINGESVET
jgi:hypothetical protein